MPKDIMSRPGFLIDVPVTLTVAVRGESLTAAQAKRIAELYAESLELIAHTPIGWTGLQHAKGTFPYHTAVTEASLEHAEEKNSNVLEELEPDN